jgi:4-amino-4-deoxy-L-arabinose transferase-like glycosyltransferase
MTSTPGLSLQTFPAPAAPAEQSACRDIALVLIAAFALGRLALDLSVGLGADEAYTVAVSRRLALSYFDHPPLHQWLAHFSALIFGEGPTVRAPFIALFAVTGWLMFTLTGDLFGPRAGLWALFGVNASAFFFASAGGWVVPDGCLLLALGAAALVLAKLFFGDHDAGAAWRLWTAAGFWLGIAGLSKYSAVFVALGVVLFMALSRRHRRWFAHPAPYFAALIALVLILPVIVWNSENGWVSFAFQGGRGAPAGHLRFDQVGAMIVGQIALLTPWIFAPLLGGLVAALPLARVDPRRLFLLCLAAPAILMFSLTPLWGARGLPHWPMPGWFFVFPLAGVWVSEGWATRYNARAWAIGASVLLAGVAFVFVTQARTGWITRFLALPAGAVDPTLEMFDWMALRDSPLIGGSSNGPPAFVISLKWSEAGKIAVALGPAIPTLIFSGDPRGMAFLDESSKYVGRDGVIVAQAASKDFAIASLRPFFADLGAPQPLALGRSGRDEIPLVLIPAYGLTRPLSLPYPRQAFRNRSSLSGG